MRIYHGKIVTCDARGTVATRLVEDRGRIVFVGDELPAAYASAPVVELGARALLPAFADTHIHFASYALFAAGLDVRSAASIAELAARVRDYAREHDERIVVGFGASAHSVEEQRLVTRAELDAAAPSRPILIVKYDGHACVVSSALLAMLPRAISGMRGYHADSGEMNQEACFAAIEFVTRHVPLLRVLRGMLSGVDRLAEKGIGLVHAVEGVGFPRDLDVDLARLFARGQASGFQMRIFLQSLDVSKATRRKLPRIGGCFATALDGCFGSQDAALLEPYRDNPASRGVTFYPDERVVAFARQANRAGLQIEMHAIGDAAFEQGVRALVAALEDAPRRDHRHTIIHACLPTERGLDACARYGIALAVQPAFLDWPQEPLRYLERILGERANRLSPLRDVLARGIVMSGGSDAPCTLPNPIAGIHAACNHYVPEQSLRVEDALRLFTYNAAWGSFDERERGSLEAGKVADMVVLSASPLAVERTRLRELRVEELLLAGEPYAPGQTVAGMLWRNLANRGARI